MLTNFKARIFKFHDLSWKDLTLLKLWSRLSRSFNSFDPESYGAPSLRVATASNDAGEPVVFAPIETVFMVSAS